MLSSASAVWASVSLCAVAAAMEGLCAGRNVRTFFESMRFPRYSAPLWVWSIIGAAYYAVFGFVLFRLLSVVPPSMLLSVALALILMMMLCNALTNLVIFRAHNLRLSCAIGWIFAGLDVILLGLVARLDARSAAALVPYLAYRAYGVWWGHALAQLNPQRP